MAKFQLNSGSLPQLASRQPQRVRMGAITLFALVVVICLAVLAVLSLTTANASLTLSQRQAVAMSELYLDEQAAQEFVAGVDDTLSELRGVIQKGRGQQGLQAVQASLDELCSKASSSVEGKVQVDAVVEDDQITADFTCGNGRLLRVVMTVGDDCAYHIEKWKMSAVQNEEPSTGQLLIVD